MFEVYRLGDKERYPIKVFAINTEGYPPKFLIYEGYWKWVDSGLYLPVEK